MELETPSSPIETPDAPEAPPAEDASIASHSAQFDRTKQEPAEAVETAALPKERHRAKSQQARAEDVPRIKELTGKWRAEQERASRLEQEITQLRSQRAAPTVGERFGPSSEPPHADSAQGGEAFPSFPDWLDKNPGKEYENYMLAFLRHENKQEETKGREAQYQQSVQQAQAYKMEAYGERLKEFASSRPDFGQKLQATIQAVNDQIPTLLYEAIIQDDNGPALLYALGSDPVFRDDMILLSDGKSVTDASVANLRRRLNLQLSRSQAGTTGSATATPPQSWTARPPNPVRTGPVTTGDEPPGEGASISDHAKYFMPKRR